MHYENGRKEQEQGLWRVAVCDLFAKFALHCIGAKTCIKMKAFYWETSKHGLWLRRRRLILHCVGLR